MNIKDLFYLSKNDRQAVFALLAILIVCLSLVVVIGGSDDGKDASASRDINGQPLTLRDSSQQALIQQATSKHPMYYQE